MGEEQMKRKSVTRLLAVALSGAMLLSSSPVAYAMEEQYQENTIDDNNNPNTVPSESLVELNVDASTGRVTIKGAGTAIITATVTETIIDQVTNDKNYTYPVKTATYT